MALYKILENFEAREGWQVGDVVAITNPETLLREGKIALADTEEAVKTVEPEVEPILEKVEQEVEDTVKTDIEQTIAQVSPKNTK